MTRRAHRWRSLHSFFFVVVALTGATGGCGGRAAEAPPESPPPAAERPASPAPEAAPSDATPPPSEPTTASSADASGAGTKGDSAAASGVDAPRDVRFVQTPEGLRVEVLGVKFVPKAVATKTPAGVGVKLTIEATTSEGRSLLAPQHGPLAFAGTIKRKGKEEQFGDERKGEGELLLDPAKPTKIVREWPGKDWGALGNGDVLELDVGLWGLGANAAERRPVKQFLRVKVVVENWKGRARVEPPPSVKGQG
jgi:hypothetical protein